MQSKSVYTKRPDDQYAVYLDDYGVKGDGVTDNTAAIQKAIYDTKKKLSFGILYVPEGDYLVSDTIYIPKAVRVIGYGEKRPRFILKDNAPGYQQEYPDDKGKCKYVFWFTGKMPEEGKPINDANPGTFYSAMSNVDIKIGKGNPYAVALRTHYAQHSFCSHIDIDIGDGMCGMFDAGNEMEDVRFFGGTYGLHTSKPSPGWPFMMTDCYFEGQKEAAIMSREAGLTIVRMQVKDTKNVIQGIPGYYEKLYMQDCQLENISGSVFVIQQEDSMMNQWNVRNVDCKNTGLLATFALSGKTIAAPGDIYKIKRLIHGIQIDELGADAEMRTTVETEILSEMPAPVPSDIPALPPMETWVNLASLGAVGDNETDNADIIQKAIEQYETIFVPQGWYRVTKPIVLKKNTKIIGLNPISTQFILPDNTEMFTGVGAPIAFVETPKGGRNIINGIGIDSGARNPRVVGCKWMAGEGSYMNDVKFLGGHGLMQWADKNGLDYIPSYDDRRTGDPNPARKWDNQYWSLWVTNGGGGTFKDVWTASTYACGGFYVSDTKTEGRVYCMSLEHHVRNELEMKNVENWKLYAIQTEEEIAEGQQCQPLELSNCKNVMFANLWTFRVIWLPNPYPYVIKNWNNEGLEILNLHNYTQVKYTINNTLIDMNSGVEVRPWQIARLYISGNEPVKRAPFAHTVTACEATKVCGGFEFPDAVCSDSKGNVYFCDSRWMRIFKVDAKSSKLSLVRDVAYKPLSLACDTDDNLLVVCEYMIPVGATKNGKPIEIPAKPPEAAGTSYGGWYFANAQIVAYSMNPNDPENTMEPMEKVPMGTIKNPAKVLIPANRWRDNNSYLTATLRKQDDCFVAPDGKTIIPNYFDLIRANSLIEGTLDKPLYAVDEYYKRIVKFDFDEIGTLKNPVVFAEKGEYSCTVGPDGNLYVADCDIYVYNPDGEIIDRIDMEERPTCVIFGGEDKKDLYITTRTSLYKARIK